MENISTHEKPSWMWEWHVTRQGLVHWIVICFYFQIDLKVRPQGHLLLTQNKLIYKFISYMEITGIFHMTMFP